MKITYYITDIGVVVKDDDSIRLKSTYTKRIISQEDFNNSNPIKINKQKYLQELNKWFKNTKYEWIHEHVHFRKLDNFEMNKWKVINYNFVNDIPSHDINKPYIGKCFIVLYQGRLYYTFISGNYFPQMQLIDFYTKELTNKWTNIKNLAPIFNCDTKKII